MFNPFKIIIDKFKVKPQDKPLEATPLEAKPLEVKPLETPPENLVKNLVKSSEVLKLEKPEKVIRNKDGSIRKRMGTPRKELDVEEFEKLCEIQCTEIEICNWFQINEDTLNTRCKEIYGKTFSEIFREKRGTGRKSLRRKQWELAGKFPAMAIWLGKQYLDQKDEPLIDNTVHFHYVTVDNKTLLKMAEQNKITLPIEAKRKLEEKNCQTQLTPS